MRFILFTYIFLSCLAAWGAPWPDSIIWKTGQVLAVSQRDAEPSTVLFEFMTGSRYGHLGMVVVQEGIPWVYEATHPHVQRVSLDDFFDKVSLNSLGEKEFTLLSPLQSLSAGQESDLTTFLKKHVQEKTPYNYSGTINPGKYNCAEFVHEAYKSADLPSIGHYQKAKDLNLETLNGKLKAIWGKKKINPLSPMITPFSIVTSSGLVPIYSTLRHDKVLSDYELYQTWRKGRSFHLFLDRFSLTEDDFKDVEKNLSLDPKAEYPGQCELLLL